MPEVRFSMPRVCQSMRGLLRFLSSIGALLVALALLAALSERGAPAAPLRLERTMSLSGVWDIVADEADAGLNGEWFDPQVADGLDGWRPVVVPGAWETALGVDYDGVAWYRRRFAPPALDEGQRLMLRFHAAATEARVWVNGRLAGEHEGPWTPFTFDITDAASATAPGAPATLILRVDEKVGHNTQGFLPVIAPHFAGLWQDVDLFVAPAASLDENHLLLRPGVSEPRSGQVSLSVEAPLRGAPLGEGHSVRFRIVDEAGAALAAGRGEPLGEDQTARWDWQGQARLWGLGAPALYRLQVEIRDDQGNCLDAVERRFGFRSAEGRERQLLLNGEPIQIRGVLTWGAYPPRIDPRPDPEAFRRQLRYFRDSGFNLIKFCLWMPPRDLLDMMDEEGMLSWIEYPTWHPTIDQAHRAALLAEYGAMAAFDHAHPSAILRSITCETGPSADLEVIQALYDLIKDRCPGTLVVDDSSWIGWNRVHDFWDDHSYGNNDWWRGKLRSLDAYRAERELKPLLMGEAIAADTWVDSGAMMAASVEGLPWWAPRWMEAQLAFERDLEERFVGFGFSPVADLRATSLKYAMDMRRWQMETFRQELPWSGYLVSTIRDVKLCAMGLLDYFDGPKWPAAQWTWHGDTMTPITTDGDRRAFAVRCGRGALTFTPHLRFAGPDGPMGDVRTVWTLRDGSADGAILDEQEWTVEAREMADLRVVDGPELRLQWRGKTDRPRPVWLERTLSLADGAVPDGKAVDWEFWALPPAPALPDGAWLRAPSEALAALFPDTAALSADGIIPDDASLVIAEALDEGLLDYLEAGGRVLHLTSDRAGAFRADGIWFLRGTVWAPPEPADFFDAVPREMLPFLQLFELGGGQVIRGEALYEQVDPLLMFIETHDLEIVRPNLMVFATGYGAGRLMVSCLRHGGRPDQGDGGPWLARQLAHWLVEGAGPERALDEPTRQAIRSTLSAETLPVEGPWRFRKDPTGEGLERGWADGGFDDGAWMDLTPRTEAEGAIWNAYDGWGWYRRELAIPVHWQGRRIRMVFDSVDDMYELYVNGRLAGGYGKMDRSESSFLKRTWVDVTDFVEPGGEDLFVVRVYDWVGSGGLNGPVWLTTGPVEAGLDLLRRH